MFQKSIVIAGALLFYLIGSPKVFSLFGPKAVQVIDSLRKENLSRRDEELIERGYYENLVSVDRFNPQLWERYQRPDKVPLSQSKAVRRTGDFFRYELVPSMEMRFHGATLRTNRWGMRDKDYEMTRPPHTLRIALLGGSVEMGDGVENQDIFESLLEERLNREAKGTPYGAYEILNFAVWGYRPMDQVAVLERKVWSFKPDAIFFGAHTRDLKRGTVGLVAKVLGADDTPYAYLKDTLSKAGVDRETPKFVASRRLLPFAGELLFRSYRYIVEECRKRGVTPVWVFLPRVDEEPRNEDFDELIQLATKAGFTILDLTAAYDGYDRELLKVAPWDDHPNAQGHRLLAERLYKAIQENEALRVLLGLGSPALG